MMDDREWMYTGRRSAGDFTQEWMMKTNDFLELAFGESVLTVDKYHFLTINET
jgi:hypothetical protein